MLSYLLCVCSSWTPVLHQHIAKSFLYEYYDYIPEELKYSFICGSIYADGFNKSITHSTKSVLDILYSINCTDSEEFWFFLGIFSHIVCDCFAHSGSKTSFITNIGTMHHISELVVCSYIFTRGNIEYILIRYNLSQIMKKYHIEEKKSFKLIYPLCYTVSILPLWAFLPSIEKGNCISSSLSDPEYHFLQHYASMQSAMKKIIHKVLDKSMTYSDMGKITTEFLNSSSCSPQVTQGSFFSRIFVLFGPFLL